MFPFFPYFPGNSVSEFPDFPYFPASRLGLVALRKLSRGSTSSLAREPIRASHSAYTSFELRPFNRTSHQAHSSSALAGRPDGRCGNTGVAVTGTASGLLVGTESANRFCVLLSQRLWIAVTSASKYQNKTRSLRSEKH